MATLIFGAIAIIIAVIGYNLMYHAYYLERRYNQGIATKDLYEAANLRAERYLTIAPWVVVGLAFALLVAGGLLV